jgi:glyoxylase-like metal-dependent hydrolase (beta-lactamase superfamily II)
MSDKGLGIALALASLAAAAPAATHAPPRTVRVAEGIYQFITPPYGDVGLDGNAVAILSSDGVLVFDSNGTPAAAEAVIAEIRKLTGKPVKYLVNSHWHWDHWYGSEAYVRAFPGVHVISQASTRAMMEGPALEFNRPGIEQQLPAYIASLEKKVSDAGHATPAPADLPTLKARLDDARFFFDQKKNVRHVLPDLTYVDQMTIYLGERTIQLLHYDRAVTPGDTFLYLPNEKVLMTGDLLVNPVSFALGCYPTGWLKTLERIDGLDATVIVPGHGEVLHDKALLHATMAVMRELLAGGADAKRRGLDPDQAKAEILPRLHDRMVELTGNDPEKNQAFRLYLVDWYLHRVYDELNGPLTDAIAPIPPK